MIFINSTLKNFLIRINNSKLGKFIPNRIKYFFLHLTYHRNKPPRPCHYSELFIKSDGNIYPCCRVWGRKEMMIGHIRDKDIYQKILHFDPPSCSCKKYAIRKVTKEDTFNCDLLNIELSLACQAKCTMCSVNAPDWTGKYDYYKDIEYLLNRIGIPSYIAVQGGEILIQHKSLDFLEKLRHNILKHNTLHIITNGNFDIESIDRFTTIFNSFTISIVGFQVETYKKIMGLELDKTIKFAEALTKLGYLDICLKYLTTPLNFHEQNLFLKWALELAPRRVIICDASFRSYINDNTHDNYWEKIISRTVTDVIHVLVNCDLNKLRNNSTTIFIENLDLYNINQEFLDNNGLKGIIKEYDT